MTRALVITALVIVAVSAFSASAVEAHPAWGIAVDRQGQVYFSDLKTVWKIDAQGRLTVFRAGDDRHTHDLNIDEDGNLYGADNSYDPPTKRFFSATWKMTPAGAFSYLLAPTDNPPEGTSIWRDRAGNMYHVGNSPGGELLVLKRAPDGQVTALVGSSKAASEYRQGVPYSAGGIAFGPDGALYFVHGPNVSRLATGGALTHLARNLMVEAAAPAGNREAGSATTQLFGIAVDAEGNAFVADYGNRRVLKITPANQLSTVLRAEASWFPTGVALRGGDLYILEISVTPQHVPLGTRVRKLSADGRVTTLATVPAGKESAESSAPGSSSDEGHGASAAQGRRFTYVLVGAGAGLFALTLIVWVVRRRIHERQVR